MHLINVTKYCLVILLCSASFLTYSQQDSANTITLKLDKGNIVHVQMPNETSSLIKYIIPYFPGLAILATLIGLWIETKSRRTDDKKKNQLERINKQISEFYLPLHALYEKGDKNWYSFKDLYGEPIDFENPNYKAWAFPVFEATNTGMRDIIIKKADLVIGSQIPQCLLNFSNWADAFKIYLNAYAQKDFDNAHWRKILDGIGHPTVQMQAYLSASVEVLKEQQNLLLTGKIKSIDETKLNELINARIKAHIKKIENDPYRKGVWERAKKQNQQQAAPFKKTINLNRYAQYVPAVALIVLIRFLKKLRKTLRLTG